MKILVFCIFACAQLTSADSIVKCGKVWQSTPCGQPTITPATQSSDPQIQTQLDLLAHISDRSKNLSGEIPVALQQARATCLQPEAMKMCQVLVLKLETQVNQQIEKQLRAKLATQKLALEQIKANQRDRKLSLDERKLQTGRRRK